MIRLHGRPRRLFGAAAFNARQSRVPGHRSTALSGSDGLQDGLQTPFRYWDFLAVIAQLRGLSNEATQIHLPKGKEQRMLIVDAQIHIWKSSKPNPNHRQIADYLSLIHI